MRRRKKSAMQIPPEILAEMDKIKRRTGIQLKTQLKLALTYAYSERGRDEWQRTDWSTDDGA